MDLLADEFLEHDGQVANFLQLRQNQVTCWCWSLTRGQELLARRALMLLAISSCLVGGLALPAPAQDGAVQKKSIDGPAGRSGTAMRYTEDRDGSPFHKVTMMADDADGRGGRCTETWVDYRTEPHQHLNPGVLVNCSGGTGSVEGAMATDYDGVAGMSVIVCEVPDTSGGIIRNESNCRGGLGAMSLHSGQRYDQFRSNGDQRPGGVRIWRV
jgi:hypothetical protein